MPSKPRTRGMYNQLDLTLYPYLPSPYFNLGLLTRVVFILGKQPHDLTSPFLIRLVVAINSLPHIHSKYHAVYLPLLGAGRNATQPCDE